MGEQQLDRFDRYILRDYSNRKPFVNFLPGIAGLNGIPMWVFYVNRGQGISSFGIASKDQPIMEFQPANKAYRQTSLQGFRTFIKIVTSGTTQLYEPYCDRPEGNVDRTMYIGRDDFEIQEISGAAGLQTNVLYFTVPNEQYAGMVRQLKLKNISGKSLKLEILDGTPIIIPYGVNDSTLKNMARLAEAWMEVFNVEARAPYFRVRATTEDTTMIDRVSEGNFALSTLDTGNGTTILKPIVDPKLIFGNQTTFLSPENFQEKRLEEIYAANQHTVGQTPCVFFGERITLEPGQEIQLASLYGYLPSMASLPALQSAFSPAYVSDKLSEVRQLSTAITSPIHSETASELFDAYARQTFLDNVMRGGMPIQLGDGRHIFHVYSRKHGDPEREYNYYYLTPENYSQGNGNYRDVNQNRRSDVLYFPYVGDYNLRFFLSLIQMDGYNPLSINGTIFQLSEEHQLTIHAEISKGSPMREFLAASFTPGGLWKEIDRESDRLTLNPLAFFNRVLSLADAQIDVAHAEGYWIDHWTYILDLLDTYLAVYPDSWNEMLFDKRDLPWFDSVAGIRPRNERYQATKNGLRQHNAVFEDETKKTDHEQQAGDQPWLSKHAGANEPLLSSVFEKLFVLLAVKSATLDPAGMGIEMEAGKPGWYDALNGLPGLLGSSVCETYETYRLASTLLTLTENAGQKEIHFPSEFADFLSGLVSILKQADLSPLDTWRQTSNLREMYRNTLPKGLQGTEIALSFQDVKDTLLVIRETLQRAVERIDSAGDPLPQTYYYYQAENLPESTADSIDLESLELTRVDLPFFLEGPMHAMRLAGTERAREIYQAVKSSNLYDAELGMYKVNESLADCSHEIGRAAAFPPGWLENESIWLHMEYKYLLEILRAGLHKEFYEDIQTSLVPFMDVDQYGRSPLENSSFIASSAYPDPSYHGNGFVARLSGSTAEFLSIWIEMFAGRRPFILEDSELVLEFKPALAEWLFDADDQAAFTFLGKTRIRYHNPRRLDTWDAIIQRIELSYEDGEQVIVNGGVIPSPYAEQVRAGQVKDILVELDRNNDG